MIYGKLKVVRVNDLTDRIGIRTLVLAQRWQASAGDLSQDELDAETPAIPAVSGGLLLVGQQTTQVDGGMRTFWTFEGINGDGKSVTFRTRFNSLDYGFTPGFSQNSIQRHPNFQSLLTQYGGYPDNDGQHVIWPTTIPNGGSSGFSKSGNTANNPMFGVNDYFRTEGTYRYRYAATSLADNILSMAGHICTPPGQPPSLIEGRNWLALSPLYRRRGIIFDITEEYWLSGPGGWPAPVYRSSNGNGSSNGLDSGFDQTAVIPGLGLVAVPAGTFS